MERKFTLLHTVATSAVFSAVSCWYGFMFGRESARKELGDLIEDLRRSKKQGNMEGRLEQKSKRKDRDGGYHEGERSRWLVPPSDMLFTNSTKCRQLSPSNNFLFIRKYVNALNPLPECELLVAKTCAYPLASYISNAFSPASSILAVCVAIFTCCTSPSGEQPACSGCSPSFISMHVKLKTTPCLANSLAIGVSHIPSTLVERHYNLELQPVFLDHLHELGIAIPVISERSVFLNQSPPGIYHDSFNTGTL
ncbi:hypothetical protein Cgig2_026838 [Carnegiea gigantea]|uniref:Uncharacterized protein n=1 Tax=Carnegiea gigantea TaxID=171969 RepID=A0A9Q1KY60_9CARY|nr:hypothetical protein Cgig2_026838 [Carnegiea gigantea]